MTKSNSNLSIRLTKNQAQQLSNLAESAGPVSGNLPSGVAQSVWQTEIYFESEKSAPKWNEDKSDLVFYIQWGIPIALTFFFTNVFLGAAIGLLLRNADGVLNPIQVRNGDTISTRLVFNLKPEYGEGGFFSTEMYQNYLDKEGNVNHSNWGVIFRDEDLSETDIENYSKFMKDDKKSIRL